jgi:hypothetical protein
MIFRSLQVLPFEVCCKVNDGFVKCYVRGNEIGNQKCSNIFVTGDVMNKPSETLHVVDPNISKLDYI